MFAHYYCGLHLCELLVLELELGGQRRAQQLQLRLLRLHLAHVHLKAEGCRPEPPKYLLSTY